VPLNLDYRKKLILNSLLKRKTYLSSEELAGLTGVSSRTIRNDIKTISRELESYGMTLNASPGLGYRIDEILKPRLFNLLEDEAVSQPIAPEERMLFIIKKLTLAPVMLSEFLELIFVSESTLDKDLDRCSVWLDPNGVKLIRRRNEVSLHGTQEQLLSVQVSYYFELSRLTGMDVETLLKNDFPQYSDVKMGFQQYADAENIKMSDDEFIGNLIILLCSISLSNKQGLAPESVESSGAAERLCDTLLQHGVREGLQPLLVTAARVDALGKRGDSYLKLRDLVSSVLDEILSGIGQHKFDDTLKEGLCSILHPLSAPGSLYYGSRVSIQELEARYPEALRLALRLVDKLTESLFETPGESDLVKLGMCFAAFLERNLLRTRKRAAVICASGIGTSQLLAVKLARFFPNLELTGIYPLHRLSDAEASEPDFIISTIDLDSDYDVVKIGNFLNNHDFDLIIPYLRKNIKGRELFQQLSSSSRFFKNIDAETPEHVIHKLCELTFGKQTAGFEKRVLEREALGATSMGNLAAIPHAVRGSGSENLISIGILEKAVRWGGENVQIVFLLRLDQPDMDMAALFDYIYSLISDRSFIRHVINKGDYSSLLKNQEGDK
jgi:probable licABCH operon transcriptional regulator